MEVEPESEVELRLDLDQREVKVCRAIFWISLVMTLVGIISLALCIVYLYQPAKIRQHEDTCIVNHCTTYIKHCCSGSGKDRYCYMHSLVKLTYTLNLDVGVNYTKLATYDCVDHADYAKWAGIYMCSDPHLKTITCYYDSQDVKDTLHLTDKYLPSTTAGVATIVIFTILLAVCLLVCAIIFYDFAKNYSTLHSLFCNSFFYEAIEKNPVELSVVHA